MNIKIGLEIWINLAIEIDIEIEIIMCLNLVMVNQREYVVERESRTFQRHPSLYLLIWSILIKTQIIDIRSFIQKLRTDLTLML